MPDLQGFFRGLVCATSFAFVVAPESRLFFITPRVYAAAARFLICCSPTPEKGRQLHTCCNFSFLGKFRELREPPDMMSVSEGDHGKADVVRGVAWILYTCWCCPPPLISQMHEVITALEWGDHFTALGWSDQQCVWSNSWTIVKYNKDAAGLLTGVQSSVFTFPFS